MKCISKFVYTLHWGQCPVEEIDQSYWSVIHYLHTKCLIWAHFETNRVAGATEKKNTLTQRNMESFQGLVILIVACTIVTCAPQILCFFLLKRTKNVSSSRINEDVNGHNREPGNPREINIQWPHLNPRKQPIEHSEQPFNQVDFMIIT